MPVIDKLVEQAPGIAALRRELHAHPELSFQEVLTADLVVRQLTEWGIPIHRGLAGTGVVGILQNGNSPRATKVSATPSTSPCRPAKSSSLISSPLMRMRSLIRTRCGEV